MAPPTPSLAQDLVRIHKVVTRAIDVSLVRGSQYLKTGFPTDQDLAGYSSYTHSLVALLDGHHSSEDHVIFPELSKWFPKVPYARLTAEHHVIQRLLEVMRPAIEKLPGDYQAGLNALIDSLHRLSALWDPHHQMEELNFSAEAVNSVMSLDDQIRISMESSKHSQEKAGPPYWLVPFVLYNLDGEDRAALAASMPPNITEELVPKVWKDQWAPMKPLLLE